MARLPKNPYAQAETRLALKPRGKPYYSPAAENISLGYRRTRRGAGTWTVRSTLGDEWTARIAIADDLEPADGKSVLNYEQAVIAARAYARGGKGSNAAVIDASRPMTLSDALTAYEAALEADGGNTYNARHPRAHLTPQLLATPIAALQARDLKAWRDSLIPAGMTRSSVNRTICNVKSALNYAKKHDERITSDHAWKTGLADFRSAKPERINSALSDEEVRAIVRAAHAHDPAFGFLIEVLAITGTRQSQAVSLLTGTKRMSKGLRVADLKVQPAKSLLRLPPSGKNGHQPPVPIPDGLATRLQRMAAGRPAGAALLLQADGSAWDQHAIRAAWRAVATACGHDPTVIKPYVLRHSSIMHHLVAGIPIRAVAAMHNTSVAMIELTYGRDIVPHTDQMFRGALLDTGPAPLRVVASR
jgi:site-specific recombinase XerD